MIYRSGRIQRWAARAEISPFNLKGTTLPVRREWESTFVRIHGYFACFPRQFSRRAPIH
jgi:hypothetical protein